MNPSRLLPFLIGWHQRAIHHRCACVHYNCSYIRSGAQEGRGSHADVGAWMDDHYAMLKDHQDIKDLPVLAVITDAKAAIAKVRTLKSTIDALSVPMAFKHELEAVEEALSEFQPKFARLIDYKEQLMTTVAKVQKQEADIITALNNQKIKFKERLEAKGIPSSVSSPMASAVAKWASGDMTRGIFLWVI